MKTPKDHPYHVKYFIQHNIFHRTKRAAKQSFYNDRVVENKQNIKNTWQSLNAIIDRKFDKSNIMHTFKVNGIEGNNPVIIADSFCKFSSSIGPRYANSIGEGETSSNAYMTNKT